MDIAASLQEVTEEVMLRLARFAAQETGKKHLCLAGGVALNCVVNGKLLRDGCFDDIWVQPAAGDAGGAAGAALAAYHLAFAGERRPSPNPRGPFLGPAYDHDETARQLTALGAHFSTHDDEELTDLVARDLDNGLVVGWMQGAAEFGPRALGNRSILGDPRPPEAQRNINLKIKFRESFRPFAPAVLGDAAATWFDIDRPSPYMTFVAPVRAGNAAIPAVTHVDGSARLQTVSSEDNPRFHALLSRFATLTGCPVLVNTSFNVRGEPMVLTPADAYACFMGTGLDRLVVGNCLLRKEDQESTTYQDHVTKFAAD
jgi:carbamoyltransferase